MARPLKRMLERLARIDGKGTVLFRHNPLRRSLERAHWLDMYELAQIEKLRMSMPRAVSFGSRFCGVCVSLL